MSQRTKPTFESRFIDSPREVLKSIPGAGLVEMDRIQVNAWCWGAGAGVKQANPDAALWTPRERINEALVTVGRTPGYQLQMM